MLALVAAMMVVELINDMMTRLHIREPVDASITWIVKIRWAAASVLGTSWYLLRMLSNSIPKMTEVELG